MKICIGMPTNRLVKPKTAASVMNLIAHSKHEYQIIISTRGFNTSENRNYIAAKATNAGCDYLFFIDDDMILPPHALEMLLSRDRDIIGGVYMTKYEKQEPVYEILDDSIPVDERVGLFEVKAIGTGCMLIKCEVFKILPQPWFKYEWNQNGSVKRSHDWIFCEDARNAGIRVFADNSLDIKHIGQYEY